MKCTRCGSTDILLTIRRKTTFGEEVATFCPKCLRVLVLNLLLWNPDLMSRSIEWASLDP